jgi:hypothetical protein
VSAHFVIAVDPGNVTGIALTLPGGGVTADECSPYAAVNLVETQQPSVVVCESFTPRAGVRTWQPDALYTIGALRYICERDGIEFVLQSPADAKRFATNDKLATIGWRHPTSGGHAEDALRHLLLISIRRGWVDPVLFADTDPA